MSPADLGTILVTGGGSRRGIGRATALRFAALGYAVAVLDLDAEAAADGGATNYSSQGGSTTAESGGSLASDEQLAALREKLSGGA